MTTSLQAQDALLTILKTRPNIDHVVDGGPPLYSDEEYIRLANTCPLCLRPNDGVDGRGDELIFADDDHPVGWYCAQCDDIVGYIFDPE